MDRAVMLRKLVRWGTEAIIVALCAAIVSGFVAQNPRAVALETYKATLQVIVIVVLGAVVKLVGDNYQAARVTALTRRDLRRAAFADLLKAYNQVKQVRRMMRARGFNQQSVKYSSEMRDFYDRQMIALGESELALEHVWKHAKVGAGPFSTQLNSKLKDCIDSMTDYLDDLIEEYENGMPSVWTCKDGDAWPQMPTLMDFVGPTKQSTFACAFSGKFYGLREDLRAEMAEDSD